nr:triple tyrosine motif-containing protein [Pedobacter sp. SYSU D00873]
MVRIVLVFFLFTASLNLIGQSQIASPKILNYSADQYKSGIQNYAVTQDKQGILYFGNKEGLLTFNGRYWNKFSLPNLTGIKSVKVDSKNRIYVGGEDELGYFFPGKNGVLKYHSLLNLIPEKQRTMAHIWNIAIVRDEVFFRSLSCIIRYKEGAVNVYKPDFEWSFLGNVGNKVYAQSKDRGVFLFENGVWKPIPGTSSLNGTTITSVLSYSKDIVLFSTMKDGLFTLAGEKLTRKPTGLDKILLADRVYSGTNIGTDWIALGTASSGLLILDKQGNLVQRYSYPEGLQNDNIRATFVDSNGSLWLGLDDGIDMIAINSAIKYIRPNRTNQVTFTTKVFNGRLYIGSSNGLYYTNLESGKTDLSLSKGEFSKVPDLHGQIWNVEEINNKLLVAHEGGLFNLNEKGINSLYSKSGVWILQPFSKVYPTQKVIAGAYSSLQLLNFEDGQFAPSTTVNGLNESLRFLVYDDATNIAWASHPYHGIYKIQLSPDLRNVVKYTLYTQQDGLPSTLYNYVYRVHNRIAIATEKGIYEYDEASNRFVFSSFFKPYFNNIPVIYLKEDNDGNVWFVTRAKEVGVVELTEEKKGQVTYFPEIKEKIVGGFESIYPYNSSNIFIGATKGVLHINYDKFKQTKKELGVLLGQVKIIGEKDSIIHGGYFTEQGSIVARQARKSIPSLSHDQNFLHFEFSSTFYNEQSNVEYSCFLEGIDKSWSPWSSKSEKDYTSLPAGKYTFKVKARDNSGLESDPVAYSFVITPVWYRSLWSYILYVFVFIFLISRLLKWQQKKHIKAQERLHYLNQLERDKTEKEIIRLKNEKLEADIDFKNRELTNMVMHLVQRGKVIEKIKDELAVVSKGSENNGNSANFKRLHRLIADVEKGEKDWEQFNSHFNKVHSDFFKNLQKVCPELTANELKLCAFIKMNLSTKEIAQLMNITPKAVEVARYRLRKKLNLNPEINLYGYLVQILEK